MICKGVLPCVGDTLCKLPLNKFLFCGVRRSKKRGKIMIKRFLSMLLSLCMVLTLFPVTAFASDGLVNVSDAVSFNKQDTYPYTGDPVDFKPTCDGIDNDRWEYAYHNNDDNSDLADAPSEPGNYTVKMSGYGDNCYAIIVHTYSIVPIVQEKIKYSVSGYTGVYDKQPHSITLNLDTDGVKVQYSTDGETWKDENPTFTDAGTYTVHYMLEKVSCETVKGSATIEIEKAVPQLYFTKGNIVFKPGEKSCKLEIVYDGDGKVTFSSSDSRHVWVDPTSGWVSLNQEGGVSIWATATETNNYKGASVMCIVESESTIPSIDISTDLGVDLDVDKVQSDQPVVPKVTENWGNNSLVQYIDIKPSKLLKNKANTVKKNLGADSSVEYLDIKLLDQKTKQEIHNVPVNVIVSYPSTIKKNYNDYDFDVLHQKEDNMIERVPIKPTSRGLMLCETTLSPFAIIYSPKSNYNLYYDVNGGTGTPLNQSVPINDTNHNIPLTSDCPQRDGYSFMGWSTSANGPVQHMPNDTITLNSDLTLYAVWSAQPSFTDDKSNPDTGYNSNFALAFALLAVSAAGLIGTGVYSTRRRSSRVK